MGNMTIKSSVKEQELMECLLNARHSGCDVLLPLSLHALAKGWHYNKLIYYINLLELGNGRY